MNLRTKLKKRFANFAGHISYIAGESLSFMLAFALIIGWIVSGPLFDFSDTWQLVINTTTTIVTFLMVFVIQNTQNRQGEAIQIKLDELIRALVAANNSILDIEDLTQDELARVKETYRNLAQSCREEGELIEELADRLLKDWEEPKTPAPKTKKTKAPPKKR